MGKDSIGNTTPKTLTKTEQNRLSGTTFLKWPMANLTPEIIWDRKGKKFFIFLKIMLC
jgi:hypothetical protein